MDLWGREDEEERTRRLFGIHAGAAEEKHFASHEELAAAIHTCTACHLRQEGNLGPVLGHSHLRRLPSPAGRKSGARPLQRPRARAAHARR